MDAKVVVVGQAVRGSVVPTRKVHEVDPLHQSSNPAISQTDQTWSETPGGDTEVPRLASP
jgi:hypothetical protein